MPLRNSHDSRGPYWAWGYNKRYYYTSGDKKSREKAKAKAVRQAHAIQRRRMNI